MKREYVRQIIAAALGLACTHGYYKWMAYQAAMERGNSAPGGELMITPFVFIILYSIFSWALKQFGADTEDNKKEGSTKSIKDKAEPSKPTSIVSPSLRTHNI